VCEAGFSFTALTDHVKLHFLGNGRQCKQAYGCLNWITWQKYSIRVNITVAIVVQKIIFYGFSRNFYGVIFIAINSNIRGFARETQKTISMMVSPYTQNWFWFHKWITWFH